jgi:hypothetical protein
VLFVSTCSLARKDSISSWRVQQCSGLLRSKSSSSRDQIDPKAERMNLWIALSSAMKR